MAVVVVTATRLNIEKSVNSTSMTRTYYNLLVIEMSRYRFQFLDYFCLCLTAAMFEIDLQCEQWFCIFMHLLKFLCPESQSGDGI